ncbi:MAG: DUF6916 family protein [Gammaproteobacteria bacterium]
MLETLTKESWATYLNSSFQVDIEGEHALLMQLQSVSGYGRPLDGKREAYSLLFRGPLQPLLPQRIYAIRHEQLGQLEIFLVPIGPDAEGMRYEAVFT